MKMTPSHPTSSPPISPRAFPELTEHPNRFLYLPNTSNVIPVVHMPTSYTSPLVPMLTQCFLCFPTDILSPLSHLRFPMSGQSDKY